MPIVEEIAGADWRDRDRNVWTSSSGISWGVAQGSRHLSCRLVVLVSLMLDWLIDFGLVNGRCWIPRVGRELRTQAVTPYLSHSDCGLVPYTCRSH